MKTRAILALAIVGAALAPSASRATQQGQQSLRIWKGADKCATQAHLAFPDYTAESNAKRDAALKACLAGGLLAPRDPLSPPAPPPAAK